MPGGGCVLSKEEHRRSLKAVSAEVKHERAMFWGTPEGTDRLTHAISRVPWCLLATGASLVDGVSGRSARCRLKIGQNREHSTVGGC